MFEILLKNQSACPNVDSMAFEELDPSNSEGHISTKCTCAHTSKAGPRKYALFPSVMYAITHYTLLFGTRCKYTSMYVYTHLRICTRASLRYVAPESKKCYKGSRRHCIHKAFKPWLPFPRPQRLLAADEDILTVGNQCCRFSRNIA